MSDQAISPPTDYAALLGDIKLRVRHAQTRAMLAVNAGLICLYWDIGALIHTRQQQQGWGAAVIPRLARDLHNELPEEKGFSERNIKRMLAFYREYADLEFVPRPVAQIEADSPLAPRKVPHAAALFSAELILALPWGHHAELMSKVKDPATRQWYMRTAFEKAMSPLPVESLRRLQMRCCVCVGATSVALSRQNRGTSGVLPPRATEVAPTALRP